MRVEYRPLSRRDFLRSAAAVSAAAATLGAPRFGLAQGPAAALPANAAILFQGDSITDCGRDRNSTQANSVYGLGTGYPLLIGANLLQEYAGSQPLIYNRGVSGNKVPDLAKRWTADCIDLNPTVVSILVGVNDLWHKLAGNYDGTVADYETGYRDLLKTTRDKLPQARIVVCEPFVLRTGSVNDSWFPEFDQRRAVAKKLAGEFGLTFVAFQSAFDAALEIAPPDYWAADGVHPSLAGHALMASEWRRATGI